MDKSQYKLLFKVLEKFSKEGILDSFVLIGSWCVYFYKEYYKGLEDIGTLRTRDMDLLVPLPLKFKGKKDIAELLKDFGFIVSFKGTEGYLKLLHSELILEFIVPERGRGSDKPHNLPQLGINAEGLRFMDMLTENTILIDVNGVKVHVPHPVSFAFHKILVSTKRRDNSKKEKDIVSATNILINLVKAREVAPIKGIFSSLHTSWQKQIIRILKENDSTALCEVIKP